MKQLIQALILITLISSCSHYGPVQVVGGEYSGREIESCTHSILGFPIDAQKKRLSSTLNQMSLKKEDIYTVEQSSWNYFFPLYTQTCNVITLSKSGSAKYQIQNNLVKEYSQESPLTQSQKEEYKQRFGQLNSIKSCRKFARPTAKKCKRYFSSLKE